MSSPMSMGPGAHAPRGAPPQYIAGMIRVTPTVHDPCDQSCGRAASGAALLLCLGLTMALLAACSKPEPGAPAQPPPAPASSATAAPASSPAPTTAPTSAPPPEPAAAAAPAPALAADAAAPVADTQASGPGVALPPAIVAFQKRRDACDHFRGEEPYDKQRAAFLKAQLAKTCKGSDRALATLRQRFATDPDALAALKGYEDRIE